jgi:hypothetical protein
LVRSPSRQALQTPFQPPSLWVRQWVLLWIRVCRQVRGRVLLANHRHLLVLSTSVLFAAALVALLLSKIQGRHSKPLFFRRRFFAPLLLLTIAPSRISRR